MRAVSWEQEVGSQLESKTYRARQLLLQIQAGLSRIHSYYRTPTAETICQTLGPGMVLKEKTVPECPAERASLVAPLQPD